MFVGRLWCDLSFHTCVTIFSSTKNIKYQENKGHFRCCSLKWFHSLRDMSVFNEFIFILKYKNSFSDSLDVFMIEKKLISI